MQYEKKYKQLKLKNFKPKKVLYNQKRYTMNYIKKKYYYEDKVEKLKRQKGRQ